METKELADLSESKNKWLESWNLIENSLKKIRRIQIKGARKCSN